MTKERRRYDGSLIRQADVIVGDPAGCVVLVAKNEQLDNIKEGAVITVRNAHANVVGEHLRLEVDRWGKIESSTEKIDKVNTTNNLSDVEYELVSVRK
jgi:replication factor A1